MDGARKYNSILDLFRRSPRAANTPVIPQPPCPSIEERLLPGIEPVERHYQQELIESMNVSLTSEEWTFVNGNELVTGKKKPADRAGCGCVVTGFGENGKQDENRVVGFCPLCLEDAYNLVAKGKLPPERIGWHASYCRNCKRSCDTCHVNTCKKHSPEITNPDRSKSYRCGPCRLNARREKLVWSPVEGVASLLIKKTPQLPPGENDDE